MRVWHLGIAVVLSFAWISASPAVSQETAKKARILMITQSKGFQHGSVKRKEGQLAVSEVAMIQLGQTTGLFTVDCSQDVDKDFTIENLKKHDIVCFYTTGDLGIPQATLDYFFNDWLKQKGHGFIGVHSATDTYHEYKPYWDMIGGTFSGHPWTAGEVVTISVHDTSHPAMKPFGSEFQIKDEIYQYKNWQPEKVHVLMSLNMEKCKVKKPYHVPVAWVKNYGEGKVYVNNLGHNEVTWTNKQFLDSLTGGIKWITNQEPGDATPNPAVSKAQEDKAKADAGGGE